MGLTIAVPTLQALGLEALALPTVVLSSHAGVPGMRGERTPIAHLEALLEALAASGALAGLDAVITGYLPSAAHVTFAVRMISAVIAASPLARIAVDPILGDWPRGLYIEPDAAHAIRDQLVPIAHLLKPNAFELGWLAGTPIASVDDAQRAARLLGLPCVVASSLPGPTAETMTTVAVERDGTWVATVNRRPRAPHGTGDLLTALLTGHILNGLATQTALARAVAVVDNAIAVDPAASSLHVPTILRLAQNDALKVTVATPL